MRKTSRFDRWLEEGSDVLLFLLLTWYFVAYVGHTLPTKYFTDKMHDQPPLIPQMEFLLPSTLGGVMIGAIFACLWLRRYGARERTALGPHTTAKISLSGLCTGVIVPTTIIMYLLPIPPFVSQVVMRGSVIVFGWIISKRMGEKTSRLENAAVVLALIGVLIVVFGKSGGTFTFFKSGLAMGAITLYLISYFGKLTIGNNYKKAMGAAYDPRPFFAAEQLSVAGFIVLAAIFFVNAPGLIGWRHEWILQVATSWHHFRFGPFIAGMPFGIAAVPSVFTFFYKGLSAAKGTLLNRLTSLFAGLVASLIFVALGGHPPTFPQWVSLAFIVASFTCTFVDVRRRTKK